MSAIPRINTQSAGSDPNKTNQKVLIQKPFFSAQVKFWDDPNISSFDTRNSTISVKPSGKCSCKESSPLSFWQRNLCHQWEVDKIATCRTDRSHLLRMSNGAGYGRSSPLMAEGYNKFEIKYWRTIYASRSYKAVRTIIRDPKFPIQWLVENLRVWVRLAA